MLDCQFYGLNAGGHHVSNVLLHAATVISLFLVLWRMTGRFWSSTLAAVIFAVHPLRVESVAWVTERKDVLSGLFFMLALGAYVSYVKHPFSVRRYVAIMAFLALGLMAKPILVTLPLVLLLLDYWPLGRFAAGPVLDPTPPLTLRLPPPMTMEGIFCSGANVSATCVPAILRRFSVFWQLVIEKLPLFFLSAIFCGVTFCTQANATVANETLPLGGRIANALVSYVDYLGQCVYPVGLVLFYPHPGDHLPIRKVFVAVAVLALISAGVLLSRRRCPYLPVGWLWYLGMLAPVIGLVQAGQQAKADRFTYLPQIGLYLALVWGAVDVCRSWPYRRWLDSATATLVLVAVMVCAWRQTSFWHDSQTLWNHALECTSRNAVAHNNLGCAWPAAGSSTRLCSSFGGCWSSTPTTPRPTTTWATPWPVAGSSMRLRSSFGGYWRSSPTTPALTTAWATPWFA